MWRLIFLVFICFLQYVAGLNQSSLCPEDISNTSELSCTTEIFGENSMENDFCRMQLYPNNSNECRKMTFGEFSHNKHLGGVTLRPYIMPKLHYNNRRSFWVNHTVLNITFSNIKWKTMKFRFQDKYVDKKNHCRNITISNNPVLDDQSVLYYDCYWAKSDDKDGQSHTLDFEATSDDMTVNRGKYYFNIPSADMLSPTTTEEKWKPFIYIEIFQTYMRLHIMPPLSQLRINSYHIKVVNACGKDETCEIKSSTIALTNKTDEILYDYDFVGSNGSFSFVVTPLHNKCVNISYGAGCQSVESPRIMISSDPPTLNICIASITALIVALLFAYYIILRAVRRYFCRDPGVYEGVVPILQPPKILVVYSSANRLHAECVASLVHYLRGEYGFEIMYDGDISVTSHGDPYIWAQEAFRLASHIVYVVGPAEETNIFNNIYDKPIISAHKDVDTLLLNFIKANRGSRNAKEIINVFFEHSDGPVPIETNFVKAKFKLIKEWQPFISYLSKDLLPKRQIMRTEKGRCFIEDLTRAKKLLGSKNNDVIVQCEKMKNFEKKILL